MTGAVRMPDLASQITQAYREDERTRPVAVTADQLPISYETITPEWLTAILCGNHPGAAVTAFKLDAPDSGTANRRRIFLSYNAAGQAAGLPKSIFCKATHALENRLMLGHSGGIHCEVTFYNKARPLVDIEAPRALFAAYDPVSFNSMVVLEDIGNDVDFCSHTTPVDRGRAESQIALLAKLHGRFYQSPLLDNELGSLYTWHQRFYNLERFNLRECCENGFAEAEQLIPPRLFARHAEIWPRTIDSVEAHKTLPHTLNHGDVHLKNWYIRHDGTMGLGDWQVTCKGHWSRDLAYTVSTALAIDDRRAWEQDLIRLYLDLMEAEGVPKIPFEDAFRLYRQQLLAALAWWTLTLTPSKQMPDMQPRDTTLEFIKRFTHAMDDLDSLDSFS